MAVTGVVVEQRRDVAADADAAAAQVRAAVLLDAVRGSVTQEVVPVMAGAVLADPAVARSVGVDLSAVPTLAGPAVAGQLRSVQRATDDAVAATSGSAAAAQARDSADRVARLRSRAAAGGDVAAVFAGYRRLVDELTGQVDAHLDAARDQDLDGSAARAVGDLGRAQRASTFASLQVPLYLGSISTDPAQQAGARALFLQAWGGYRATDAELNAHAGAFARQAWARATGSDGARQVDAAVDAAATTGAQLSPPQFLTLTTANTSRDAALRQAVQAVGEQAVRASARPARQAAADLRHLLLAAGALLALTGAVTGAVHRFIARPLRRLAVQAEAVRDGELDDQRLELAEGGPREVRTLARGLAATVAGLRRVREQAQAVADGDTTSEVVRTPLAGSLGAVVHASITQMIGAIHERERLQVSLAHQASHDALTQLPNRAQALVLVEAALHRARRTGQSIGLLFVDLDHFKAVNDSFGHGAGDELLRVVAARMQATVRGGDAVCRLGGDEFVVLVEPAEDHHQLIELGRRLIAALSEPVPLGGRPGDRVARIGASIGVAVSAPTSTPDRLLREADAAAYRAKGGGRGLVEVFDEALRQELARQGETEQALRQALSGGELLLHYQPVLDLVSGRTEGVEALIRWQRPGHGLVPPDEFIPVAERSDLICDLGRWALHTALAQLAAWDSGTGTDADDGGTGGSAGLAGLGVAVNISGRHLGARYLLDDVADALAASRIDPARLTLEITETVLVDQPIAIEQLRSLRELGVRIAIDDFGTGYTSIGQLPQLPVDILKIDRSFVASPGEGHAELVRLVISAAHSFSLGVVAEGVEQDAQLQSLIAASCDSGQGFLFARPSAAGDLALPAPCPAPSRVRR
nr:EAL domain-containing protein [Kineococcus vitellinus]